MRILLAEDDGDLAAMLGRALRRKGHVVDVAISGGEALWMSGQVPYDALVLDVNLPAPDGFTVCRALRERAVWTPVVFLTGRGDVPDRIAGLDAGGDDYLVKPVAIGELDARLRAVGRRGAPPRPTILEARDLRIDPAARRAWRGSHDIPLTAKEFALLELLVRHPGEVVSRQQIGETLWDFAFDPASNVIEAHVRRLRRKLDRSSEPSSIETVRGAGYRFRSGC
jgi:two-component system OmpR family response regulator